MNDFKKEYDRIMDIVEAWNERGRKRGKALKQKEEIIALFEKGWSIREIKNFYSERFSYGAIRGLIVNNVECCEGNNMLVSKNFCFKVYSMLKEGYDADEIAEEYSLKKKEKKAVFDAVNKNKEMFRQLYGKRLNY